MSDQAENRNSAPLSPPMRNAKGQILKGFTGNPHGRPKGRSFKNRLKAATNENQDVIDTMVGFAQGTLRCSPRDRIEACKWIADRTEGKAADVVVEMTAETYLEHLAEVSEADLVALARAPLPTPQNLPQLAPGESLNPSEEQEPTG